MNLLFFHLEADFGEDIKLIANNELDLEDYLIEKGYKNIRFADLSKDYGTCTFTDQYKKELAKCFYITKI